VISYQALSQAGARGWLGLFVDKSGLDGYLFKLFGMPIDWKATKQRSVTKSTTEAELYALSRAASCKGAMG
jgi:hypothetical protein